MLALHLPCAPSLPSPVAVPSPLCCVGFKVSLLQGAFIAPSSWLGGGSELFRVWQPLPRPLLRHNAYGFLLTLPALSAAPACHLMGKHFSWYQWECPWV